MQPSTYACIAAALLSLAVVYERRRQRRATYPPGPPGEAIIGNLRDMPRQVPCLTYEEWARQYGSITYVEVLGKPIVILNDYKTCTDLLDKRGHIYSDRPRLVMACELAGLSGSTALARYDAKLKRHRRFLAGTLNAKVVWRDYASLQERKALMYVKTCLENPSQYKENVRRITGEAATEIAYGAHRDEEYDWIELNNELALLSRAHTQGYLVELIPALKYIPDWFPGAEFKKTAKAWRRTYEWTRDRLMQHVIDARASGKPIPASYASRLLNEHAGVKEDEEIISASAFTFYRAGNDTTIAILQAFILAMALYPEIQKAAQAEIDEVLGEGQVPTLADRNRLPCVTAICIESLRWIPSLPTGLPHRLMEEDNYKGYTIPAGSTVIPNVWNMSRNPVDYPNPDTFDPSRFKGIPYDISAPKPEGTPLDPRSWMFGFGRRICPGNHLGFQGLWISVACILWGFDIQNASPHLSRDTPPRDLFQLGFTSEPNPFDCRFVPRNGQVAEKIDEALAANVVTTIFDESDK